MSHYHNSSSSSNNGGNPNQNNYNPNQNPVLNYIPNTRSDQPHQNPTPNHIPNHTSDLHSINRNNGNFLSTSSSNQLPKYDQHIQQQYGGNGQYNNSTPGGGRGGRGGGSYNHNNNYSNNNNNNQYQQNYVANNVINNDYPSYQPQPYQQQHSNRSTLQPYHQQQQSSMNQFGHNNPTVTEQQFVKHQQQQNENVMDPNHPMFAQWKELRMSTSEIMSTSTGTPVVANNAEVINYIKKKPSAQHLTIEEIQHKLIQAEVFDIKGEGSEADTGLMEILLKENDFYEKPSQKIMREETMKFVKKVVDDWSTQIAQTEMRINIDEVSNYTAKLLPFGSYVLDLKSNSSDIDLICVCPKFIQRDTHFFEDLASRIESDPDVKNFSKVVNARVPIVTFVYKDTDVDISYCQLNQEFIPRDIEKVISNDLVKSITDERSKTAILGRRNNLMILELCGDKQLENFKQTLRVVKVWAKNRGVSSNGMGFLGGISWAILVAKICQIFQNHTPSRLLAEFFMIYTIWNWKAMPVNIMKPGDEKFDKYKMCVTTPGSAYNSTERVNYITYKVLMEQLRRANELMMTKNKLSEICKKSQFFDRFPLYIQIDICGKGDDQSGLRNPEKDYKEFQGNVTSKMLKLMTNFYTSNRILLQDEAFKIHPNPNFYKKNDPVYEYCNACFMGIDFSKPQKLTDLNLERAVIDWCHFINKNRSAEKKDYLNVRVFEGTKQDFSDVEINEPSKKKKEEKEDPRLAMRRAKA